MSLIVSFKGQFNEYPLMHPGEHLGLERTRRADAFFEELLRHHISENEFNHIIEKHQQSRSLKTQKKHNPYLQNKKMVKPQYKHFTRAHQIMTRSPETMDPEDSLQQAISKMLQHNHRHFPVVEKRKLIGIVSDRDLLLATTKSTTASTVQEIMKEKVITAKDSTEIKEIAMAMLGEGIGSIPIINDDYFVIGIITRTDFLKMITQQANIAIDA